ncbi:hypothetical protein [uncultured Nitratireductor sp.]
MPSSRNTRKLARRMIRITTNASRSRCLRR